VTSVAGVIRLLDIRNQTLSVDEVLAAVSEPTAGGICIFIGTVRNVDHDQSVTRLEYEAHPTVQRALTEVAEKVAAAVPDATALAAVHRVGTLAVGDLAVVVAASAPHRAEAFAACRQFIDDLKSEVPIWKHQLFADGTDEWVGAGG